MYRDQFGEFVCGYWGLKGYTDSSRSPQMHFSYLLYMKPLLSGHIY